MYALSKILKQITHYFCSAEALRINTIETLFEGWSYRIIGKDQQLKNGSFNYILGMFELDPSLFDITSCMQA